MKRLTTALVMLMSLICASNVFAEGTWTSFTNANFISDITIHGDYLWCATGGGVVRWNVLDKTYEKFTSESGLASNIVLSIGIGKDGAVWCGTFGGGVSRYHGEEWTTFTDYKLKSFSPISGLRVFTLNINSEGIIICGTTNGISMFDGETWTRYSRENGLPDMGARSVAVGPNDVIWIGAYGNYGKVSRFDGEIWTTFTKNDGLGDNHINAIAVDPEGVVWFGTNRGVSRYDGETWSTFTTYDGLLNNNVTSIAIGKGSEIYFGTNGGGISRYDGKTWSIFLTNDNLIENSVKTIAVGLQNDIWFGTNNGSVLRYDSTIWSNFTTEPVLIGTSITSAVVSTDENVWIGTSDKGILRYDGDEWTNFTINHGLAHNNVNSIAITSDGTVWIGTQGGVSKYDGQKWETITGNGLTGAYVSSLDVDINGNVWVGVYGKGIIRFDGKDWKWFTSEDGLLSYNIRSLICEPDGKVICLTSDIIPGWALQWNSFRYDGKLWAEYSILKGLNYRIIYSIAISHDGAIWIGTEKGLIRFDSETRTTFEISDGLASNDVYAIAIDHNEDIWIGTEGGISRLVYEADNDQPNNGDLSDDRPKVAIIATRYTGASHADVIGTRLIEGYGYYGENRIPRVNVVSMYVDQVSSSDISWAMADEYGFGIYPTIRETLLMGADSLAVDGVLLIVEHGDYPMNEKGQKLYPRYEFYKEVMDVFRETGKSVPVFTDKHFSVDWNEAKWMYDQSLELGFPMMAGSSLPVTWRHPPMEIDKGTPIEKAVVTISSGGIDSYGIHALETLQCMVERRGSGETGIKAVQYLEGSSAWAWTDNNPWAEELMEEAMSRDPDRKTGSIRDIKIPMLFLLEYTSGLDAVVLLNNDLMSSRYFGFAAKVKGSETPVSTAFWLQGTYFNHFSSLAYYIEELIVNGEPSYPVERTLLTTGALAAIMDSRYNNGSFGDEGLRIETPHLNIVYTAQEESVYNQGEVPPYDNIFVAEEKPVEFKLMQNYPNPFNPFTTIEFFLPSDSIVDLSIYNITGQKVRTLVSEPLTTGQHSVRWDGTSDSGQVVSSGVYIVRISIGNKVAARSMMLVK